MRAFTVTWKALVAYYRELFLLAGMSLLWWACGGFVVAIAIVFGAPLLLAGGPWWLVPLAVIPAGPATAALAVVAQRVVRDRHADRSTFREGLRAHWRPALALSSASMAVLSLLILNLLFYLDRPNPLLQGFVVLWLYLILFWLAVQMYAYPVLVAMERPAGLGALKVAALAAAANPFYSLVLPLVAIALAAFSAAVAILIIAALPAVAVLQGQLSLDLFMRRAGVNTGDEDEEEA